MLDPFSLLPLALAARGGRVDDFEVQQLVAAGLTLLQRSATLVRALSRRRAAILLPTSPAFFTALGASEGRGAVLINPLSAAPEIAHQLADANAGAVFTIASLADLLPPGVPLVLLDDAPRSARVVVDGVARDVDLGSHFGMNVTGDTDIAGSDDEAAIVYTSAMAGTPLGAILSHRNLIANARSTAEASGISGDDVVLALLPFAHLFGLTVTASAPLLAGGRVVTMPKFDPRHVIQLAAKNGVTAIVGVPAMFRAILSTMGGHAERFPHELQLCICGGSPLSVELQDRWFEATGVELRQGYGLTEAGPCCLFNRVDRDNARGTLGVPLSGVEVELRTPIAFDDAGRPLPGVAASTTSDVGEICVRGESVFRGYVSHGEHGLQIRDGWLHTGDLGRRDAAGRIVFAGMAKPMFTRNGFNIYPREIEHAVVAMPGVIEAHARELPEADRESEIALEVRGAVDAEAVKQWCARRLGAYKQPASITSL